MEKDEMQRIDAKNEGEDIDLKDKLDELAELPQPKKSKTRTNNKNNKRRRISSVCLLIKRVKQTLINTNKRSYEFQKDIARSGPISFAQTTDNMAKESGQAVERAVVFAKMYSTKDGHPVSTDVGDKIKKMTEILNNGGSLQGECRQGILWSKTDAFAQVMGKECCGRVRGVGFGPTPSGRSGSNLPCYTLTPPSSSETAQRMTELENSLRDELAQSEQRHQEQIAELHAQHKEEIAELHAQHKVEITEAIVNAMRSMLKQMRPLLSSSQFSQGSAASQ